MILDVLNDTSEVSCCRLVYLKADAEKRLAVQGVDCGSSHFVHIEERIYRELGFILDKCFPSSPPLEGNPSRLPKDSSFKKINAGASLDRGPG